MNIHDNIFFLYKFKTSFGFIAIIWTEKYKKVSIERIILPQGDKIQSNSFQDYCSQMFPWKEIVIKTCDEISLLSQEIKAFLDGQNINLSMILLNFKKCAPFQKTVLETEAKIPRGYVSTYAHIASLCGNSKAIRATGTALATNPFPLIIPCHRTIRSDRSLGGYQGGLIMKKRLLEMEGCRFDKQERVEHKFIYHNSAQP